MSLHSARSVEITPEYAERLLTQGNNAHQRHRSPHHVRKIADAMIQERWHETAQPIVIGSDGSVLDGQHRLEAIIQSGTTQKMLIVEGEDPGAFAFYDIGLKRNASQFIHSKYPAIIKRASVMDTFYDAHGHLRGYMEWSQNLNIEEELAMVDTWPAVTALAPQAATAYRACRINAPILLAVTAAGSENIDDEIVDKWFDGIMTGADLKVGDARLAIREAYRLGYRSLSTHRASIFKAWAYMVRAWNGWVNEETVKAFRYSGDITSVPPILGSRYWLESR